MLFMKCRLLTILIAFLSYVANAQQNPAVADSFKLKIARAKTPEEKVEAIAQLSMVLMNTNQAEADKYGGEMIKEAEMSRKRNLMSKAHFYNGLRYSFLSMNKEFVQKSIASYTTALDIAKKNKLDKETVEALLGLAGITLKVPDLDKSLTYTTDAFAIASTIKDDSLQVACYISYGDVYGRKKERLLSLRNYLQALRIAEETKHHNSLRSCYSSLSSFYMGIKEYDKAIDFAQKAAEELPSMVIENKNYLRVVDLYGLGNLYMLKKNFEMSVHYFEESIRLADSLNYHPLKMPGYNGLLNQYLESNQPQKALEFFNKRADLKQFIYTMGFGHVVDAAYGVIYSKLHQVDSARAYFAKAAPGYNSKAAPSNRLVFYTQYGDMYKETGDLRQAIAYYTHANLLADTINNLEWQQETAKELDTLYANVGDYQQSRLYSNLYHLYKDSLQKLGEQRDLMQAELADEQQRQERIKKEELAALERKHTVQYTGISIGIGMVFILLVAMGIFRVSETTIKIMGFFSFILFFEFIILLADTKIHHWTHGEPLPILAIKIILIAALLPLHHWLEHKVVHYLTSRRLIIPERRSIWHTLTLRNKSSKEAVQNVSHPH